MLVGRILPPRGVVLPPYGVQGRARGSIIGHQLTVHAQRAPHRVVAAVQEFLLPRGRSIVLAATTDPSLIVVVSALTVVVSALAVTVLTIAVTVTALTIAVTAAPLRAGNRI